jgi:hypothetical protein
MDATKGNKNHLFETKQGGFRVKFMVANHIQDGVAVLLLNQREYDRLKENYKDTPHE